MITGNPAAWEWLARHQPPRSSQCSFLPIACPRPDVGHFCGAFTADWQRKANAQSVINALPTPCWVVASTTARMTTVTQQLHLFEPPAIHWLHQQPGAPREPLPYRIWHIAPYFCKHGRDWALLNEKRMGYRSIRVKEIRKKAGCKTKALARPYTEFCI